VVGAWPVTGEGSQQQQLHVYYSSAPHFPVGDKKHLKLGHQFQQSAAHHPATKKFMLP
jgi:hypothetical protein